MTPNAEAVAASLDARIARAEGLAAVYPATAAMLTFYARLATAQRSLLLKAPAALRTPADAESALAARIDTRTVAALVPGVLDWLAREAPPAFRDTARLLRADGPDEWRARLDARLGTETESEAAAPSAFVCDAVLQPFAEAAARALMPAPSAVTPVPGQPATCPCCGGLPVVGVLRERGHGAGRALVCGRCLSEWAAPRMMCPACGGLEVEALPVFRAGEWPAVRLDACETCRAYLKSVDLTVDGRAISVVDDLASVPLDLWAAEQGFHKGRANLLRV